MSFFCIQGSMQKVYIVELGQADIAAIQQLYGPKTSKTLTTRFSPNLMYQYKILMKINPWKILPQRPLSIIIPCCRAQPAIWPTGITLKALKGFDWKSIYKKIHWLALVGGQLVCIMLAAASRANFWSHHQVVCCQKYICSHPFLC